MQDFLFALSRCCFKIYFINSSVNYLGRFIGYTSQVIFYYLSNSSQTFQFQNELKSDKWYRVVSYSETHVTNSKIQFEFKWTTCKWTNVISSNNDVFMAKKFIFILIMSIHQLFYMCIWYRKIFNDSFFFCIFCRWCYYLFAVKVNHVVPPPHLFVNH